MHKSRKKFGVFYNAALTDNCASQCSLLVIPAPSSVIQVADTGLLYDDVMKVADYLDPEDNQIIKARSQCQLLG
ncbi:MAG: hypothetical protein O7157_00995 [Wolbachia endosymbiont of Tetragnatha montana]|nr:hypothetical protein [Wolbachia endosymbiont of Tetragnatha montana]